MIDPTHPAIVAWNNFAERMAKIGNNDYVSVPEYLEEEQNFLAMISQKMAIPPTHDTSLATEDKLALWEDIEQKSAVTDAYDTGLTVEDQEFVLWKDIEQKSATTDAFDSGLTAKDQAQALWKDIEQKSAVTDAYNTFAEEWVETNKAMKEDI